MVWAIEIIQDFDGRYYANVSIKESRKFGVDCEPKLIKGLPEYVDYKTLSKAIKDKIGIEIPKRKDLHFSQFQRKKYALINGLIEEAAQFNM